MISPSVSYFLSATAIIFFNILSTLATARTPQSEWYRCIKPRKLTPPRIAFPIVWTTLYIVLFLAFAESIRKNITSINVLFILLLALNALWCYLYFAQKRVAHAAIILALIILTNATMIFISIYKKENHLAFMLGPHLLWVCFAFLLNILSIKKVAKCASLLW